MEHWKDRTVLITGGASGIGRALAAELARRGAIVTATDLEGDAVLDVRDLRAFRAVVDGIVARHGRLDALFNNAGTGISGETWELGPEHWQHVIDVNINGVVNGVLAAYPQMVRQGAGRIVNVASLAGLGVAPFLVPYAMSKHAVVGLSTSLRIEAAAHGVEVNVLCPAAIETPLLDKENPANLPPVSWRPNTRRYLTSLSGPPYPVGKFAAEAIDAVERNEGMIVIPARARVAWRLGRFLPRFVEKMVARATRQERAAPQIAR